MDSEVYKIQNAVLQPLVQYILFNKCTEVGTREISFSNTNYCLGVIQGSELVRLEDGSITNVDKGGIHSYLSGIYLQPHHFNVGVKLDEICIDFTPLGYRKFFNFEPQDYILGEDITWELWGNYANDFFVEVFHQGDNQVRGAMIELLLLNKLKNRSSAFIDEVLLSIDHLGIKNMKDLRKLNLSSERKLQRHFKNSLGISPSQYLRVKRFRALLNANSYDDRPTLSDLAYTYGLCDQSHLVKEFQFFTNSSPSQMKRSLVSIDDMVFVSA